MAQQYQPDLIIFDYSLPDIDGRETIERIQEESDLSKITAIGTSALNITESDRIGDDFLPKPINIKKLLKLLATHLKLKWIYPEQLDELDNQKDTLAMDVDNIIMPSLDLLTSFLDLIKQGNIWQLQQQVKQLKEAESQYVEFSKYLNQLANNFQLKKLRQFIQNAIDKS